MSELDPKTIVSRLFLEGWNQKKIDELDQYISRDNVITGLLAKGPAGPDQYRGFMESWHAGFPDFKYQIEAIICEGDLVAVRTLFMGTHKGQFAFEGRVFPPTGKTLRVPEIFFFRVVNGNIVETWATWDRLSVLAQLGVAPVA